MATASRLDPLWKAGRYPELDGLRAVAVLFVILTHVLQSSPGLIWPTGGPEWTAPLNNGWMGVDLFFVLSGYLVGGQIYRRALEGRFDFREFYLRRAWRILPAYFCLLALLTGIAQISPAAYRVVAVDPFTWHGLIKNAALVTDYAFHDMGIRSWSLSVEEQFYWLAPWLLLGLARLRRHWRLPALMMLFLLAVGSRAWSYHTYGLGPDADVLEVFRHIYLPFHSRLDGLIAGADSVQRRERAVEHVVDALEPARLLDRENIRGAFDHADESMIAVG
jgi:peptidoglycan/LPS O-acetylase OafA/YrhL